MKKILLAILLLLPLAAAGGYLLVNQGVKEEVDAMIAQAESSGAYQDISYQDLSVGLNGDIRLREVLMVDAGGHALGFEEVVVSDYDKAHELPHHLSLQLRGLRLPEGLPSFGEEPPPEGLQDYFAELQADGQAIPLQVETGYRYDPDNRHQVDSAMSFSLSGAANGEFRSTTRGVPLEAMFMMPSGGDPALAQMQLLGQMAAAEFPHLAFSLSDTGVVDRWMRLKAGDFGLEPAAYREQTISQVRNFYLFAPQGLQETLRPVADAAARFLEGGKTLKVSLNPAFEGRLQQLQPALMGALLNQDYEGMAELLNLEVSTQ